MYLRCFGFGGRRRWLVPGVFVSVNRYDLRCWASHQAGLEVPEGERHAGSSFEDLDGVARCR